MTELDLTKLRHPLESYVYAAYSRHHGTGYRVRVYGAHTVFLGESLGDNLGFKEAQAIAVEFNRVLHAHKVLLK